MSVRPAACCLLVAAVCVPLAAQSAKLVQDMAFVRALARELRFVALAQSEADRLRAEYKDSDEATKSLAQLGIEVSLIGAKLHGDREQKRTLFKEGLERTAALVERYPNDPVALAARVTMADATIEFGRFLAEEIEIAREEDPDKVPPLEEEAQRVFRAGVDACEKAMAELEKTKNRNPQDKIEFHVTWLRKGILLREQARAVKKDRDYLCSLSRDTLEELIFDVGEETLLGQKALFEHAQNDEVLGRSDEAARSYRDVIESIFGAMTSDDLELPSDVRELMVVLMEEAYDRRANVLLQGGRTDDVLATVAEYRDRLKKLDVPLTEFKDDGAVVDGSEDERFGHSLYITEARAMAETGKLDLVAKGLKQATYFNDKHPNDLVGLLAKNVIKEIVAAQAKLVSGALLFQAAKGDFQAKEYEPAIRGFKKALGVMTTEELAKLGLEAYYLMGSAFVAQGRRLEATLALLAGLQKHADAPENADMPARAANLVQRTLAQARTDAKNDKSLDPLAEQVTAATLAHGSVGNLAKRLYDQGLARMAAREFDEGIKLFEQIPTSSAWYDLGVTQVISAHQRRDDNAAARKALDAFREFVKTKDGEIPNDDTVRQQTRQAALARVHFYDGYLKYLDAEKDGKKDLTRFPEVINLLGDFEQTLGNQAPELVPRAHYVVGRSYVEIGQLDKAEERYRTLQKVSPRNPTIAVLASAILSAYHDQIQARLTEIESLQKTGDPAAITKAQQDLTLVRRKALAMGLDYLKTSEEPNYRNAYVVLRVAEDLKDWAEVETLGNLIIKTFDKGKDKDKVDKYVKEIVGTALLRQHKYKQAHDLLVDVEAANPGKLTVKRDISLALGGWIEVDERGTIQPFPGMGEPAKAYDKYWGEYRTYGLHPDKAPRYSLDWYRFHLECLYFARKAQASDTAYKSRADSLYNIAEANDDFRTLRNLGKEGSDLADMFLQLR
jgi:tetratricopeptide (TPR) repeat protein